MQLSVSQLANIHAHRIDRCGRRLILSLLLGLFWIAPAQSQQPKADPGKARATDHEESWQVIHIGDQRIGYSWSETKAVSDDGRDFTRTTSDTHLSIKRFGQTLRMQMLMQVDEGPDGNMLGFVHETRNPPATSTKTIGTIRGDRLTTETTVNGNTTTKVAAWDPDVKAPSFQDQLIRDPAMKPGDVRSFKTFVPDLNKVTKVTITARDFKETKVFDGSTKRLLELNVAQDALPGFDTQAYIDAQGEMHKSETDFLGMKMITFTVDKAEALKAIEGGELDLAVGTLVKVPRIAPGHNSKKVVYRVKTPGEDPAEFLVADGQRQKVKQVDKHTVELEINALPLPKSASPAAADNSLQEFLAPTQFLQSDDEKVKEHAMLAAGAETNPPKVAAAMEKYVHEKLTEKNFSTALASAGEVARTLEGDCTEHAVLLAAMLRAAKIPSRIAVGLVYIERSPSFGGHMWTEAYLDGKWIPLDATLGRGGIGAVHIKLAESSFADDAPAPVTTFVPILRILGKIELHVMSAE